MRNRIPNNDSINLFPPYSLISKFAALCVIIKMNQRYDFIAGLFILFKVL